MENLADNTGGAATPRRLPRRLSTHQKAVLIQVLTIFPGERAGVLYEASDREAGEYAQDFVTIFKAINWEVERSEAAENLPASRSGICILARRGTIPSSAEALRDVLRIYEIEAEILQDGPWRATEDNFILAVSARN